MRFDFTGNKNDAFSEAVFPNPQYPLDLAAEWIQDQLSPEDVFTDDQLDEWAANNGWVKENQ